MGIFDFISANPPVQQQPLPQNLDAEGVLLGGLMMNNAAIHLITYLTPDHFFEPLHQRIFASLLAKTQQGEVGNPVTMRLEFEQDERLKEIGGAGYLGRLAGLAPLTHDIRPYALEVFRTANKRQMIVWCQEAIVRLTSADEAAQAEEIAASLSSQLNGLNASASSMRTRNDRQITEEILASLNERPRPFSTGLAKLDLAMGGGLHPGKSYGFAARKKVGKTVLASTISCNLNLVGVKHLFVCGEMGPHEIQERNLARLTNHYPSDFRDEHRLSKSFQQAIADASVRSKKCIIYQNAPGLTFDQLRQYISAAVHKHKITGVILDYWQLVGGKGRSQSTAEHLDAVAQWLADFGRQHGLWNIVMAQINQEGNTRGGEGMRLAFDQVYQINREDVTGSQAWLEMMDTRYTSWMNIGSATEAGLIMMDKGPYFEQAA